MGYNDDPSKSDLNLNIDRGKTYFIKVLNLCEGVDPYAAQKIQLFTRVIDLESLSDLSEIYGESWSIHALKLQNECMRADTELQIMEVGQAHSILVSDAQKVYSYGWNDCNQLGRTTNTSDLRFTYGQIPIPFEQFKPKSV